jgi:hypothetical protein
MSEHRTHVDVSEDGTTIRAACGCGWSGSEVPAGDGRARDEAKQHRGVSLHMTETEPYSDPDVGTGWVVRCRCLWSSGPHEDRGEARRMGDWHLEQTNRPAV